MTAYLPWIFSAGSRIRARPLVSEGVAYFGTDDGYMYAARIGSWDEEWRFETGGRIVSTPALDSGILYFGSEDGFFYALDAVRGTQIWRFEAGGPVAAPAAVTQGAVLFGTLEGTFHALDAGSGREIWSITARGPVSTEPAIAADIVGFTDGQGGAFALRITTGEIAYASDEPRAATAMAMSGDLMIFGSTTNMLAVRISSGEQAWEFPVYHHGISDPLIAGGTVCFGAGNYLYALDADSGMPKWEVVTGSALKGTAARSGTTLFLTTRKQGILALDLDTGHEWWSFDAGPEELSPPVAAGNWLFTGSSDGNLYGYELQPPTEGSAPGSLPGAGGAAAAPDQSQPPHLAYHVHGRIYSNAREAWHLYPLILLSFNIFQYYWFFRNWKYLNIMGLRPVRPGWRLAGLLSPILFPMLAGMAGALLRAVSGVEADALFFDVLLGGTLVCYVLSLYLMYDQFRTIRSVAREQGVESFPLFLVVSAYFTLQNLPSLLGNVVGEIAGEPEVGIVLPLLALSGVFFLLSIFVLTIVQKTINRIWEQRFPQIPVRRGFTMGEKVLMSVFGTLWILTIVLLPPVLFL